KDEASNTAALSNSPSATTSAAATGYQGTVLADGPAAYWRLGEASGTVAADSSPNARNATYGTGVAYGRAGALAGDTNTAVLLNGGSIAMPSSVNPWSGNFTIEAWINPHGTPAGGDADGILIWEQYLVHGFRTGWSSTLAPVFWTSESGGS